MAKMLVMSLLPMASSIQVMEREAHPHVDFEGMKTSLKSLAVKSAQKGKIDQGTIEAVTGFLKTIKDDLLSALEADRSHSQATLDAAEDGVHTCDTNRNAWFDASTGTFGTRNGEVAGLRGDHDTCRTQEGVTYANYTSHCATMHNRVCGTWATSVCALPSGGFAAGDTDAVNTYMNCVCDFFEEHRDHYYNERTACETAHNLHDIQVAACDTDQGEFEDDYCAREGEVQDACELYDGCRFGAETTYLSVKSETEALEQIFQAQFVALKHLQCYGEQILNNSTDLSNCDSVGDDCEADYSGECPQIVYDVLDPFIQCAEPTDLWPCTVNFIIDFYDLYAGSFTPVDDCHTCANAEVTGNTWGGGRKTDPN